MAFPVRTNQPVYSTGTFCEWSLYTWLLKMCLPSVAARTKLRIAFRFPDLLWKNDSEDIYLNFYEFFRYLFSTYYARRIFDIIANCRLVIKSLLCLLVAVKFSANYTHIFFYFILLLIGNNSTYLMCLLWRLCKLVTIAFKCIVTA